MASTLSGNGIYFVRQWHDTGVRDAMAKEVNALTTELALGDTDDQAIYSQSHWNSWGRCFLCVSMSLLANQNVVDVDKSEI